MLQLIKPDTKIDFVGKRKYALLASGLLCLLGLVVLVRPGPRYGIDFAGGTLLQVRFQQQVEIGQVRAALGELGPEVSVQEFGTTRGEYLLRVPQSATEPGKVGEQIRRALEQRFGGASSFEILRTETVGPRVGAELRRKAFLAVLFATLMMGVYIAVRFEVRFGIGAAVALLHDVIVTTAVLILFGYDFDLTIVAALLTIVGFSVNDTVIVSDRIRENMRKSRRQHLGTIINQSINETLSRTVLTTGTGLLVIVALYFLGGDVIHGFAFALLVGFTVGTYSSIFIASPVVLAFERAVTPSRSPQRAAS